MSDMASQSWLYTLLETGWVPEWLIRWGIRRFLRQKATSLRAPSMEQRQDQLSAFVEELKKLPIAIETQAANEQHYEVPAEFFDRVLGPRRKYSSGYWATGCQSLQQAEEAMLALTCRRADIYDGQVILDLGCGWGAMTLWLAQHYPQATIVGLSNSHSQREWILKQADERGFRNVQVWTGNIAEFETDWRFDRIISIEMFEHMKNYQQLLAKLSRWLKPEGQLFVHIFTHQFAAYHYEDTDGSDWLTRYFFTGGTMPSHSLLSYFQDDLTLTHQWMVDGTHYQKTAEAWWANMQREREQVWPILTRTYGAHQARRWWVRWQTFFLACAELWGYDHGREWLVSHYRFAKRAG